PLRLRYEYSLDDLAELMRRDTDGVARWDAGQSLAVRVLQQRIAASGAAPVPAAEERLLDGFRWLLGDTSSDRALIAQMLILPGEAYLAELVESIDPQAIHAARSSLRRDIASRLRDSLLRCYLGNVGGSAYRVEAADIARRSLKNACLSYLLLLDDEEARDLAYQQYYAQENMSDVLAALHAMLQATGAIGLEMAQEMLLDFRARWHHEPLAMNLWLQAQATRSGTDTLDEVKRLRVSAEFDVRNPNKVRALIGSFANANPGSFHLPDHAGYRFLGEQVAGIDALNPMIAARLLVPLTRWRRFAPPYRDGMRAELEKLLEHRGLSRDCFEVVSKSLA
ncbi:MAG TPA: aminopeptidase N C-terminal domain-containing protein, partial [Pseudomonadales bacterium]|nr:aminopeptidase N C-terminal domain-containing protein [Pseudomonadales bacterium]